MTSDSAGYVAYGPYSCPSGTPVPPYTSQNPALPICCTTYEDLQQDCAREEKWMAAMSIISSTLKIAGDLVSGNVLGGITGMVSMASTLANGGLIFFNPDTTMPPLPNMNVNGTAFENPQYADQSYEWYLNSEQNLSQSLITFSSAYWDNIYLQNEETVGPGECLFDGLIS